MTPSQEETPQSYIRKMKLHVPGEFRTVSVLLIIVIVGMLVSWRPWQPVIKASDRTITVTGNATVSATPDQYVFSPSYQFTNSDKQVALNDLSKKSDEIIKGLKNLGVANTDIKSNANGYGSEGTYTPVGGQSNTYTLSLVITVHTVSLVQKVQDYLITTTPAGEVSPATSFSTAMTQTLQSQARQKAEQDARTQADQSAKNLGFKVAAVKSVTDGSLNSGGPILYGTAQSSGATESQSQLSVQPGQNDLNYSVTVVYYIE